MIKYFNQAAKEAGITALGNSLELFFRWGQHDITVRNLPVVPLQKDGPGSPLVAIQGAAGDAGNFLVVNDRFAIESDSNLAPHQSDIVALPLTGLF